MLYFGHKEVNLEYPIREGAYGILIRDEKMLLISTPRGYFLPGGGIEAGEDHVMAVKREFEEETGIVVDVGDYIMSNKEFGYAPGLNKHIEMIGHYYHVYDTGRRVDQIEDDHSKAWLSLADATYTLKIALQAFLPYKLLKESSNPTLYPYDHHWTVWFDNIKRILMDALSSDVESIEHVGSTAIKGMLSKAIIDIDILLKEGGDFERVKEDLSIIGYIHMGDQGVKDREAFKRDGKISHDVLDNLPHHLYVCPQGSKEYQRHIRFRDTLRQNDTLREEYIRIKDEIISRVGLYDRMAYVDSKAKDYQEFFEAIHKELGD